MTGRLVLAVLALALSGCTDATPAAPEPLSALSGHVFARFNPGTNNERFIPVPGVTMHGDGPERLQPHNTDEGGYFSWDRIRAGRYTVKLVLASLPANTTCNLHERAVEIDPGEHRRDLDFFCDYVAPRGSAK